ncbi:site-specific integrase [Kitasatospora indigofera]|uniref:hypothetical protein n=1 Tax=Kitasatospora indigofera TaxID=67307 RepID=UPI00367DD44E
MSGWTSGHAGLDGAVRRILDDEERPLSEARRRQVKWVAGEIGRALAHPEHPLDEDADLEQIITTPHAWAYLQLGGEGKLRVRQAAPDGRAVESSDKSGRVRVEVLGRLADVSGIPRHRVPALPPDPPAKIPVAGRPRQQMRQSLRQVAERYGAGGAGRLRMMALAEMVLDTGSRAGELVGQQLEDLAPDLGRARLRRRPQGTAETKPDVVELLVLTPPTRTALAAWLRERSVIVQRVEGGAGALWVSVRHNHAGGRGGDGKALPHPAGLPLEARGLARAYTRAVAEVNDEMAGEPSWEPLPTRMEQVRRGVRPQTVLAPSNRAPSPGSVRRWRGQLAGAARELAAALDQEGPQAPRTLAAQEAVCGLQDTAWAEGVEHQVLLGALADGGLELRYLPLAGWEPALLEAIDLQQRFGRHPYLDQGQELPVEAAADAGA